MDSPPMSSPRLIPLHDDESWPLPTSSRRYVEGPPYLDEGMLNTGMTVLLKALASSGANAAAPLHPNELTKARVERRHAQERTQARVKEQKAYATKLSTVGVHWLEEHPDAGSPSIDRFGRRMPMAP